MNLEEINFRDVTWACAILYIGLFCNGFINIRNFSWTADIVFHLIVPLSVMMFLFKKSGLTFTAINMNIPKGRFEELRLCLHIVLISFLNYFFYKYFYVFSVDLLPFEKTGVPEFWYGKVLPQVWGERFIIAFYFSVTAGFFEEFYFRGLLTLLFDHYGMNRIWSGVLISLAFGSVHWESGIQNVLATFLYGGVMIGYYFKYRMLLPLIAGHFMTDFYILFVK